MLAQHLGDSLAADTAAAGVNYDWMQEFADQATRRRRHVQADDHRLRRRPRQPQRVSRRHEAAARRRWPRPPPISCLWMFLAGGIIDRYARDRALARARVLRRVRRLLLPLSPARRRPAGSSTACCSVRCTRGCSTALYRRIDARHERRAHRVSRSAWGSIVAVRRCSSARATWSSTTRRCARSSRTGAACSARSAPRCASFAALGAAVGLYLLNVALFLAVRRGLRRRRARRRDGAGDCGWDSRSARCTSSPGCG